ncbi:MAG: HD domain-containing protein [Deltaproteobacteria bacterium]|nr:HD domain-containing protein [Deltaproteobacteria bacterium]
MGTAQYIPATKSQLRFYRDVELYARAEGKGFVLYKRAGITLSEMRLEHGIHPKVLFIRQTDKLRGLREAQKGFNKELEHFVEAKEPAKIKETVVNVVQETLAEPRSGSLEGISDTVGLLVNDYIRQSDVIKTLVDMSSTDYSVIMHSINVMAFALAFAFHMRYPEAQARTLGLSALLHDVGKTKINPHLLAAPRKLTEEEFEEVKRHTTIGYDLLRGCKFAQKEIALTALEHHEKLDGSGYPKGKFNISETAKIVGIIDCYEALTTDERPYREAMEPFDTLDEIIGNEVKLGKFDKDIYCEFVRSLGGRKSRLSLKQFYAPPYGNARVAGITG